MAIKNKFLMQGNNTDYGHKNILINGAFDIWQRGTSFTNPTDTVTAYCADRWASVRSGYTSGITTSRSYQGNVTTIRLQRTAGNTSTMPLFFGQSIETLEATKYAGKTVTLSFKAIKGANLSGTFGIGLVYGTGNNVGNGITVPLTNQNAVYPANFTLTSTLSQYSYTFTIPSNATQIVVQFLNTPTGTAGANDWFEVGEVQLELGSVATTFEHRPYALELMLCQRFYYTPASVEIHRSPIVGQAFAWKPFPVTMRAVPTVTGTNITYASTSSLTWYNTTNNGTELYYQSSVVSGYVGVKLIADAEL